MSFVRVLIKFEVTFYAVLHDSQYTMDDVNNHYNYVKTKGMVLVYLIGLKCIQSLKNANVIH